MRCTTRSNLIREQVSFIYVHKTCTHGHVVESMYSNNEGKAYHVHDQANLEAKYELIEGKKVWRGNL